MKYPCPCCGSMAFAAPAGSYDVCAVCGWEDDAAQLRFPLRAGCANRLCLWDSQRAFISSAKPHRDREPIWRPLDRRRDFVEPECTDPDIDLSGTGPNDPSELYYWRETFWLRADRHAYLNGRSCLIPRRSFAERELLDARGRLFAALGALAATGDAETARSALAPPGGKAILYLAALPQADQFALDPVQRAHLLSLYYALSLPADGSVDATLFVRSLASAIVARETENAS